MVLIAQKSKKKENNSGIDSSKKQKRKENNSGGRMKLDDYFGSTYKKESELCIQNLS